MANDKREDDGVVTSAPASSVGSLLTDLLSEAKKDVAAERQQLESKLHRRESEQKEERQRDEARKREALQQKLVEETRLRNQALAGAKRDVIAAERIGASTAPHMRPVLDDLPPLAAAATPVQAPKRRGVPTLLAAALVLVGIGAGVGGAFALTPTQRINLPDINVAARAIVAQTAKAAMAEGEVTRALTSANDRIKALEGRMDEALAAQKKLAAEFEATKSELEAAKQALADADTGSAKKPTNGHRGGTNHGSSSGVPNIDTSIFK
ncbi:MAG: hypothetical protein CVU56_18775 [Deltaproteobacteria bacterium HGW-Deltaproteobacteria-14]|nr:MAG: hypothetical protein CVU56_18775 [Deltaproteobacteria bacterium HGW-Deltaproteobacteria-14]